MTDSPRYGGKPRPKFAGANFGSLGKLVSPLDLHARGVLQTSGMVLRSNFDSSVLGLRQGSALHPLRALP